MARTEKPITAKSGEDIPNFVLQQITAERVHHG
jgi:hypothetical protein